MKKIRVLYARLMYPIWAALCCIFWTCTKDADPPSGVTNRVEIKTADIRSLMADSAMSGGVILSDGGDSIVERGVCWSAVDTPKAEGPYRTTDGKGVGSFTSRVKPLNPNTRYLLRAYAKNAQGFIYGNLLALTTPSRPPSVVTVSATSVTHVAATVNGNVTSDGGASVTERGILWSRNNPLPDWSDSILPCGSGTGAFSGNLKVLSGSTRYFFRAWAKNAQGTALASNAIAFTTEPPKAPVLGTLSLSNLGRVSVDATSSIVSNEGAPTSRYGFCWSTSPNPNVNSPGRRILSGAKLGAFTEQLTGLAPGTTYHVSAFAENPGGIAYTAPVTFTTQPQTPAIVTMTSVGSVGISTAGLSGNVTDNGGASVTARGFFISLTNPPTASSTAVSAGSGTGAFTGTATGLLPSRTYFVKAYAVNQVATALSSNTLTFTTQAGAPPTVTTITPSVITQSSFSISGNVLSDGGTSVTERGFCYAETPNPDITKSKVVSGSGTGSFSALISGLQPNRTYYVRAYAINASLPGYGTQMTVVTQLQAPSLQSPSANATIGCCNPGFQWSAVNGATMYEIQFSRNVDFTGSALRIGECGGASSLNPGFVNWNNVNVNATCVNSGPSSNNGNWYWRVRAFNGSNTSAWSSVLLFRYTW
jgi:hypothetical protein